MSFSCFYPVHRHDVSASPSDVLGMELPPLDNKVLPVQQIIQALQESLSMLMASVEISGDLIHSDDTVVRTHLGMKVGLSLLNFVAVVNYLVICS